MVNNILFKMKNILKNINILIIIANIGIVISFILKVFAVPFGTLGFMVCSFLASCLCAINAAHSLKDENGLKVGDKTITSKFFSMIGMCILYILILFRIMHYPSLGYVYEVIAGFAMVAAFVVEGITIQKRAKMSGTSMSIRKPNWYLFAIVILALCYVAVLRYCGENVITVE